MLSMAHDIVDIAIVCSNFKRSLEFYRDQLGLEVVLEIDIPESTACTAQLAPRAFRQVRLRAGQTLIKLVEIADPPTSRDIEFQAGVRWLTFLVHDLPTTVENLKQQGVYFLSEPVSAPDAKYVVCAEAPDGVLVELVQVE